jgi:hypothetical protein
LVKKLKTIIIKKETVCMSYKLTTEVIKFFFLIFTIVIPFLFKKELLNNNNAMLVIPERRSSIGDFETLEDDYNDYNDYDDYDDLCYQLFNNSKHKP